MDYLRTIPDLMENLPTKTKEDPKEWLRAALQNAVALELATLPVYLSGLWSIKDGSGTAYDLIYSVAMEEMVHMGLTANMLASLGGIPAIPAPTYPRRGLPGDVKPEIEIFLSGLTPKVVGDLYMEIEKPEHPLATYAMYRGKAYPTVGAFYSAISEYFGELKDSDLKADNQLNGYPVVNSEVIFLVNNVKLAQMACQEIKEQGEGTSKSPYDGPDFGKDLAHYYKFGEVYREKKIIQVGDKWEYKGDPVPFPKCHPMAKVPEGGYVHKPDLPGQVKRDLETFDQTWTNLIKQLRDVWNPSVSGTPKDKMDLAVRTMRRLESPAVSLMSQPLSPETAGNYGPDWIYREA